MLILLFQQRIDLLRRVRQRRICRHVPAARMDKDQVRVKRLQLRVVKHHILPVLRILRLIELRADALLQQKHLQHPDDIMGRAAAEHRDLFIQKTRPGL